MATTTTWRCLTPFRRKILMNKRLISIWIVCIFVTLSVAFYQRLSQSYYSNQNDAVVDGGKPEHRAIRLEAEINQPSALKLSPPVRQEIDEESTDDEQQQCVEPPKGFQADFDTFDLLKNVNNIKFPSTNNHEKLKVFVLPFTHVDPGWLETFESYTKKTNAILDNMHQFMMKNEAMRFMWAEFVFFERWWSLQTDAVKADVRRLVNEGRLELASGSWVMTDEANAWFPVSVDNIVEGFQFINDNFNRTVSVVWSNDPFGYSNSVPFLFRKAGIKWNVINRIHHSMKQQLQQQSAIPFNWRQYFDKDGSNDVLTHVLPYTHYDVLNSCGPSQSECCLFDFKRINHWSCPGQRPVPITSRNVKDRAQQLVNQLVSMSKMYKTPTLLMMHGDDFRYDEMEEWNQQHDNFMPLFEEINKGDQVEIRFGTFSDYFNEMMANIEKDQKLRPPTLSGDFFPYLCALGDYWTGYYTTRPFFKRQGRILHNLIRTGDLLLSRVNNLMIDKQQQKSIIDELKKCRRILSLFQHHDAITGTSKVSVMKNYSELLFESSKKMRKILEEMMTSLIDNQSMMTFFAKSVDENEKLREISIENEKEVEIHVFNSLSFEVEDLVTLKIDSIDVTVSIDDKEIRAQIEPIVEDGKVEKTKFALVFRAKIAPLSFLKFVIKKSIKSELVEKVSISTNNLYEARKVLGSNWNVAKVGTSVSLKSSFIETHHNPKNGNFEKFTNKFGEFKTNQKWLIYSQAGGGAYLMRLSGKPKNLMKESQFFLKFGGEIRSTIHQFNEIVHQSISVKNVDGSGANEIEIRVSVDIRQQRNTELMTTFASDFVSPLKFTDSVGLQLLRRESRGDKIEANYYPMPSAVVLLEKTGKRLTIVSNLEHGARFIDNGGVEINIDRILNQDDGKGLGNGDDAIPIDMKPVEMRFKLVGEQTLDDGGEKREEADDGDEPDKKYSTHTLGGQRAVQSVLYPFLVFSTTVLAGASKSENRLKTLSSELPCDLQLLTIRPISINEHFLIIFRHAISGKCDAEMCSGRSLKKSLKEWLNVMGAKRIERTNLSGISNETKIEKFENFDDYKVDIFDFLSLKVYFD